TRENIVRRVRFGEVGPGTAVRRTQPRREESSDGDTYERTLELIGEGKSFEEIAEVRGLTTASILRHIMVLAGDGHALDLSEHLNAELLPKVREVAADWEVGNPLAALKEKLPIHFSYDDLKLHLAHLLVERHGGGPKSTITSS